MWRLLKQHEKVVLFKGGIIKEAHYFHKPLNQVLAGRLRYLKQFPPLNASERPGIAIGEHTPGYSWRIPYSCRRHASGSQPCN